MIARLAALLCLCASGAAAFTPDLPAAARLLSERESALDSYRLPVGPFDGETVPATLVEGRIDRRTWRIDGSGSTTLQILDPIRSQIEAAGYDVTFECEDRICGGFDFRFGTEVVPAPHMFVDVRDFRMLSAVKGEGEALGLLVSRSRSAAFVQIVSVSPPGDAAPEETAPDPAAPPTALSESDMVDTLVRTGHVVLGDLTFGTGADALDPGDYVTLERLADYLATNPGVRIALVGHTDSVGGLETNIALSRRRAQSVRQRLIDRYQIDPARLEGEGMGYLAPVGSNLTPEGRELNRRVEAVLLSDG